MKAITLGHCYVLDNFERPSEPGQILQFIEKAPTEYPAYDGEIRTTHDGTTNEEVLKMLINRLNYLNGKFPCRENSIALTHVETALLWLEKRTADRKARGVEGKNLK